MSNYERLAALDASFLHLERLEYPMHVGAVSVFEGAPFFGSDGHFRLAEVRDLVESRLTLIPRYHKRLMFVQFDQGRPVWIDDDQFDIGYHVRLTALPRPGSWEQLVALTQTIEEQLLDRERPLWELWFVEGLEDGKVALIQKTHHALVDGVSGVDVATMLLDMSPEYMPVEPPEWVPEPAPTASELLVETLRERITEPAEIMRTVRRAMRGPRVAARRAKQLARSLSTFVERDAVAPRTSLNTSLTGRHRRLATARVPLDDVKRIRRSYGGTVNDIVLSGVSGALARLLRSRGEEVDDMSLRVLCPVSVRDDTERNTLGNKVSAMFITLPIGISNPAERLDAIHANTKYLKEREQAVGADFLLGLTTYAAPTLMNLAARVVHRQPFINLIVTNVPGPQVPLYLMGARMLEAFPIVPLTRNLSVVVGILSYDGVLYFGLYGDRDACSDIEVLAAALDDSFAEMLEQAEGLGAQPA